jgi:hypothetical protein
VSIDLTGQTFGRLFVEGRARLDRRNYWVCRCECGQTRLNNTTDLTHGKAKSCGCWKLELAIARLTRHGCSSPSARAQTAYLVWASAKSRCYNKNNKKYADYGGRGITMCDEWRNNFATFAKDMGPRPIGYELDRIDNDGNYCPSNCRWANATEQVRNRRCAIVIEWKGQAKRLPDWADELGLSYSMLKRRYQRGWEPDRMFTQPSGDSGHRSMAYRATQPHFCRGHKKNAA